MEETKTVSVKLLNAILNYLANKPFVEVQGLIQAIQQEAEQTPATVTPPSVEEPVEE